MARPDNHELRGAVDRCCERQKGMPGAPRQVGTGGAQSGPLLALVADATSGAGRSGTASGDDRVCTVCRASSTRVPEAHSVTALDTKSAAAGKGVGV